MPDIRKVQIIPVLAVAGLYAAGDAVGAVIAVPVVDFPGRGGRITGIEIIDKAAQALGITLHLFDVAPAAVTDNAVYDRTDADAVLAVGQIPVVAGDYVGGASNKTAYKDVDLNFQTKPADVNLYLQCFTQGAPTYAAGDLIINFFIEQAERARY